MSSIEELSARRRRWLISRGLLRALLTAAVVVALYYVLPLDPPSDAYLVLELLIGVVVLVAVIGWEVRAIVRSRFPAIRAIQALAVVTSFFLVLFASVYFALGANEPTTFSEPLSRSDALYFTITVFSTVGFGDVTARTDGTRLLVSGQMLLDLVILGLGVQVLLGAVNRGRSRQAETTAAG